MSEYLSCKACNSNGCDLVEERVSLLNDAISINTEPHQPLQGDHVVLECAALKSLYSGVEWKRDEILENLIKSGLSNLA